MFCGFYIQQFNFHVHCVLGMNYEPASSITILGHSWGGQKAQPILYIQIEGLLPQPLACCEAPCAKDYFPNHGPVFFFGGNFSHLGEIKNLLSFCFRFPVFAKKSRNKCF
jgi:hypothetical protein